MLAASAALSPVAGPAAAHPHVFVDAEIVFRLGEGGALEALRVTWAFDAFYSMLLLAEMGMDPVAAPDAAALAALAALQPDWARDFGGAGAARYDEAEIALAPAEAVSAEVADGRLRIAFDRPLAAPVDPSAGAVLAEVYDPTFFVAYSMLEAPRVEGPGAEDCSAVLRPFAPNQETDALQSALMALGMDETPETPQVGRVFADSAALTCRARAPRAAP
ncbi:DUF1007 family protein [Rubrimonas cliftonensis]|uniref:DUF1007 family protein n=1 Tax=Rubrimonas cliftonensis TaxID=89524 RepID=UPI0015878AB9|nr:DUF1007 family protein [Rubrimonas cliftonensis]